MPNYEENFAYNVKRLRKSAGLTQKMLADAVGCSEKTVSKWESGASIPYIGILFALAQILHTGIENLFVDAAKVYYLGIDGGGTKTAFKLTDSSNTVLRTLQTGPCNPYDIGMSTAQDILRRAVFEVCADIPLSSVVVFAGIAGGTAGENKTQLTDFFETFHFLRVENGSDNDNLIAAGLHGTDGITLLMGTGICLFTVQGGIKRRMSGWGYLFDDGGSAFNYGRDAIHAAYAAFDGSGPETMLLPMLEKMENCAMDELLSALYQGGKRRVASYAPLVFTAAKKGDAVAEAIITRNITVVTDLLRAAETQFPGDMPIPVVLAGGLTAEDMVLHKIKDFLGTHTRLHLRILEEEPVDGAVLLARQLYPARENNDTEEVS